jgi:glycerol-3-phosphate O-acyltransferase
MAGIDRDATVVFVMNHRSNMDYVLVTWLAAERSALSYAVGEWARVWPLSLLIKAMGAFFIRRRERDRLYGRVLARYVGMATDGGVTQAVFPEGRLSLDGAPLTPRHGLIKHIVEERGRDARDVVFVPVALNYDRVFEDRLLIAAGRDGGRKFPARISVIARFILWQAWLRLRGRYHRHGYAAVSFGVPMSLQAFQADHPGSDSRALTRALMARIKAEVPVLPVPLVARALLRADGPLDQPALVARIGGMLDALSRTQSYVPESDPERAARFGVGILRDRGLIEERSDGIAIVEAERPVLAYYAASIAHLFRDRSVD